MLFTCSCFFCQCRYVAFRAFSNPVTDKICSSALLEDVKELYEKISIAHPDIYRHVDQKTLDSLYVELVNGCSEDQTLLSFVGSVSAFLQALKDSHTFVSLRELLPYQSLKRHYLPMRLMEQEGNIYVVKSFKNRLPSGVQLLKVNGFSVDSLLRIAPGFTPKESLAESAFALFQTHVVSALINLNNPKQRNVYQWYDGKDTLEQPLKSPRFSKIHRHDFFHGEAVDIRYTREGNVAILKIGSFSPKNLKRFRKQLDEVFQDILDKPTEKLVLDLRFNSGGFIVLQEYLMSFLVPENTVYTSTYVYKRSPYDRFAQLSKLERRRFIQTAERFYPRGAISRELDFYRKPMGSLDTVRNSPVLKNRMAKSFLGPCNLLVNEGSMSASANFTAWFMEKHRGEVFGSAVSGTNAGTFANPHTFFLPNTGLPISVSTMKVNLDSGAEKELPLIPNHVVIPTPKELQLEIDAVMNFAINH